MYDTTEGGTGLSANLTSAGITGMPTDFANPYLDTATDEKIAENYKISRSRVKQIERRLFPKHKPPERNLTD